MFVFSKVAPRRQHDLAWRHFPVLLCCLGTFHARNILFLIPFLRVRSHYCLLYEFSKLLGQESRFGKLAIVSLRLRLKAELGRLCPFSAPRGHTFSTCPPRFPPRVFHGQIFTPDQHKVSAPNAPHQKMIQIIRS